MPDIDCRQPFGTRTVYVKSEGLADTIQRIAGGCGR